MEVDFLCEISAGVTWVVTHTKSIKLLLVLRFELGEKLQSRKINNWSVYVLEKPPEMVLTDVNGPSTISKIQTRAFLDMDPIIHLIDI